MNSTNINKPSLKDRFRNSLNNFTSRFSGWDFRKVARVILYAGGIIFVIVLVISAGRAPFSQTATNLTQAPAAFTINKWYESGGLPTVKSGGTVIAHLRIRNPGQAQSVKVRDYMPDNFTYVVGSQGVNCPGLGGLSGGLVGGHHEYDLTNVPNIDNCEIFYQMIVP